MRRIGARYTNVDVGDEVLMRQDKVNKFATTFNQTPCVVVRKSGNSLIVESPDGVQYSRNSSHVRKYVTASSDGDVGTAAGTNNETPTIRPESPDGSASRSADTQPIVTEGPTPIVSQRRQLQRVRPGDHSERERCPSSWQTM